MARGGDMTMRVNLQGEQQVVKGLRSIGPAGAQAMREIQQAQRTPTAGMLMLNRASIEAGEALGNVAGQGGAAARIVSAIGPAGMAAAVGIGAVIAATAAAVHQARQAMAFADEIDDAAAKIGIGVESLQAWRYAVRASGGEIADADAALAGFTRTLGAAMSNLSPKAMKPFAALGFTREELRNVKDVEKFLDEVTKRIAALSSEAERAAVTEKLGLTPMLPLLRQGATEMENLRQKAYDLGIVMSEDLVKKGAAAQDQFETLQQVLKVQLASAFVELAPLIIAAMQAIVDASKAFNDFLQDCADVERGLAQLKQPLDDVLDVLNSLASIGEIVIGIKLPELHPALNAVRELVGLLTMIPGADRLGKAWESLRRAGAAERTDPRPVAGVGGLGGMMPRADAGDTRLETPSRGSRGGKGRSGPTAEEIAAKREELELQNALNLAEAAGAKAVIKYLKEELEYRKLVKEFKDAGYGQAEAQQLAAVEIERLSAARAMRAEREQTIKDEAAAAEAGQKAIRDFVDNKKKAEALAFALAEDRLQLELEIARAAGNEAEVKRLADLADIVSRARDKVASGARFDDAMNEANAEHAAVAHAEDVGKLAAFLKGAAKAAYDGDFAGFFQNWYAEQLQKSWERAIDAVAPMLQKIFDALAAKLVEALNSGGDSGSGSDWISMAANFISAAFGMPTSGSGNVPGVGGGVPGRATGGDASGWIDIHANERLWVPPGSHVMDANNTRRRSDAARFASLSHGPGSAAGYGAGGARGVPVVTLNNRTAEPMKAEAGQDDQGRMRIDLYPLIKPAIQRAGKEGVLQRSLSAGPKMRRRG